LVKLSAEITSTFADAVRAGASFEDAARVAEISHNTAKTWLTRGRKGEKRYQPFAVAIDAARAEAAERPEPMDEDELLVVVSEAARRGSVQAMKLRWEMIRDSRIATEEEPADPLAALDELAARRAA
jgi:transposase